MAPLWNHQQGFAFPVGWGLLIRALPRAWLTPGTSLHLCGAGRAALRAPPAPQVWGINANGLHSAPMIHLLRKGRRRGCWAQSWVLLCVSPQPWLSCPGSGTASMEARPQHAKVSRWFFLSSILMRVFEASYQPWVCAWGTGSLGEVGGEGCGAFLVLFCLTLAVNDFQCPV